MSSNPLKNPIGLDISDLKLRFFQFDKKGAKKIKIRAFGEIDVPAGAIFNGEIKDEAIVINLIKKLLNKPLFGRISGKYINACLPEKNSFIKVISVPLVPEEERRGTVAWGIEQNIPIALEEAYFDWCSLEQPASPKKTDKMEVVVAVAAKSLVDSYIQILEKAGYILTNLENESFAIARCLLDQKSDIRDPLIIVDLGKSRTNIMIYAKNTVQFSSTIDINGTAMTQLISKNLKLSFDDAEKAKIICGLDKRKARGAIGAILEPIISRLADKIKENIDYYGEYLGSNEKINTVILTGSAAQMSGLTKFLLDRLQANIIIGDPWGNITAFSPEEKKIINQYSFHSFTTAIGLALKNYF